MDKTEQYIKKCEKAEKIQEVYKPTQGDYAVRACEYPNYRVGLVSWNRDQGIENLRWKLLDEWDGITLKKDGGYLQKLIWLPHQDQLQEMVIDKSISGMGLAYDLWKFIKYTKGTEYLLGYSMEQLWLAFVMKEKYGKIWSQEKEEWIKGQ